MNKLIIDIINSVYHSPTNFSIELPNSIIDDKDKFLSILQYNLDYLYLNTNVDDLIIFYEEEFCDEYESSEEENMDYHEVNINIGHGFDTYC